jgi:hypothetical protein
MSAGKSCRLLFSLVAQNAAVVIKQTSIRYVNHEASAAGSPFSTVRSSWDNVLAISTLWVPNCRTAYPPAPLSAPRNTAFHLGPRGGEIDGAARAGAGAGVDYGRVEGAPREGKGRTP